MDTSGVLVAAKDSQTASLATAQFAGKQVSKAYLALCLGVPQQQHFTVDGPIDQHPTVKVARCVAPGGQPAATHVQVRTGWSVLCCARQGTSMCAPCESRVLCSPDQLKTSNGVGCKV